MDTFKTTIEVGGYYLINPLNPRCRKHRGRMCKVLEIIDSHHVRVKLLETKRTARVKVSDLTDFEDDIDI
ncbi:MAG: hypothetical protein AYP45_16130 [Candidatus Brocadia carolinensis]|uniref:Uncharacterized protein n=1 Tax=Candidatus Brocadia carolinensis TaxID=1004156 RepID=A0A1V4AQ02_9BACT|nr:MAG: hypothetical protein AYP45_16130 [Candidatus Brocadia caroliniensis]